MAAEHISWLIQANCSHETHEHYTRRRFDILNGFEITETKCLNCHKITLLDVKKIGRCPKSNRE